MALVDRDQALVALRSLDQRVRPVTLAERRVLPVSTHLAPLLPWEGLRRGTSIATEGDAAVSLALALLAEATTAGSWAAVVALPELGLAAAAELGVAVDRLALVPEVPRDAWPTVVAALVDAVDLVVVGPGPVRPTDVRRVAARAREAGAVLVPVGSWWPEPVDLRLTTVRTRWHGLGEGHGHLSARRARIESTGRRAAVRARRVDLWLPAAGGGIGTVEHPSLGEGTRPAPTTTGPDTRPTGRPAHLRPVG